ncbi:MAG: AAA family ATPase, partial [Deltaproteobacteria bacterium]|nr:AAA family ATPase [Deltaproteobacteria bacterium]
MTLKKLPLGNQSFGRIIDRNLLYADKTRYIYNLVKSEDRNYFLSRPRRFGKTLLLSALEELFTGHRERFKGLWIDGSDYDFPR